MSFTERLTRSPSKTITVVVLLSLAAAIFSTGFCEPGEHIDILEAAAERLAGGGLDALSDNFQLKRQSWLLPGVAALVMKMGGANADPFCTALILRLIAALIGTAATLALLVSIDGWFQETKLRRTVVVSLVCLWYLPFLNARFSAESLSRSLFVLGFIPIILSVQRALPLRRCTALLSGLSLALAFESDYWSFYVIAPSLIWFFTFGKSSIKAIVFLILGALLGLGLAALVNKWGYGHWWFPAAPFFYQTLFLKPIAWTPPWGYLTWLITATPPVWGVSLILGTIGAWILKPRLSLTWATLGYVAVLFVFGLRLGHELFLIASIVPPLVFLGVQEAVQRRPDLGGSQAVRLLWIVLAFTNVLALGYLTFTPARQEIALYRSVWNTKADTIHSLSTNPYEVGDKMIRFYSRPDLKMISGFTQVDLEQKVKAGTSFFATAPLFEEAGMYLRYNPDCRAIDIGAKAWILGTDFERLTRSLWRPWGLFECAFRK